MTRRRRDGACGARRAIGVALCIGLGGLAMAAGTAGAVERDVVTFGYTGEEERFVVPAGVTSIGVVATGAKGQRGQDGRFPGPGGPGGLGARVAAQLAVTSGQTLYVRVGGPGVAGGFNGGGLGATGSAFLQGFGGNGGGATDLRTCPAAAAVCPDGAASSLLSRLVVAGGGGGGGGGVSSAQPSPSGTGGSAPAGSATGGDGTDAEYPGFGGGGGAGGGRDAPGSGGIGRNGGQDGFPGVDAAGGAGGSGGGNSGHGAGGGGGWFGGGGGGAGFGGGGGGAGSSYGPAGTVYGVDATGVSSLAIYFSAPQVVTGAAGPVTQTTATLTGRVNPQAQDTTWWFEYGTDSSYGTRAPATVGDAGSGVEAVPVSVDLSRLEAGTTYHFRLVAENPAGTSAGVDRTFTTPPADPSPPMLAPAARTGTATGITATAATLSATVTPNGRATTWWIEYGRTTGDIVTAPVPAAGAGAGNDALAVALPVGDLTPGTLYHYRVVAANAAGVTEGAFRTFQTAARPDPPAARPALGMTVAALSPRPRAGARVNLRVRVVNRGVSPATGVRVRVSLPARLRTISAPRGCRVGARIVVCSLPSALRPGAARTFTVRARALTPGRAQVTASVVPRGPRATAWVRVGR